MEEKETKKVKRTSVKANKDAGIELSDNSKTLEEAFSELDALLRDMDNPNLSLEESFAKYNKGLELIKYCENSVQKIEDRITVLEEGGC